MVPLNVHVRPSPKDCAALIAAGHDFFREVQPLSGKHDRSKSVPEQPAAKRQKVDPETPLDLNKQLEKMIEKAVEDRVSAAL